MISAEIMSQNFSPNMSIIIPAYNAGTYVSECLDSVLKQTYQDFEIFVIDDGSEDDTVEIVSGYGDKVTLLQQPNLGSAAARNLGAKNATGKWLAFLDADDTWVAEKLERQIAHCEDKVWSHTDWLYVDTQRDLDVKGSDRAAMYGGKILAQLIVTNFIGTSTVIVRRDAFVGVGGFDDNLRALQDWDLWLRIAEKHEIAYLPDPLTRYRVHASSTSRSPRKTERYHLDLVRRIFDEDGVGASMTHLRKRTLAHSYCVLSIIAEESGDCSFAFICAVKSVWYYPKDTYRWKSIARIALGSLLAAVR